MVVCLSSLGRLTLRPLGKISFFDLDGVLVSLLLITFLFEGATLLELLPDWPTFAVAAVELDVADVF